MEVVMEGLLCECGVPVGAFTPTGKSGKNSRFPTISGLHFLVDEKRT